MNTPRPSVPKGWYPDPAGGPFFRWWDGQQWTSETSSEVPDTASSSQIVQTPPPGHAPSARTPRDLLTWARAPRRRVLLVGLAIAAAAIFIVTSVAFSNSDGGRRLAGNGPSKNWEYNNKGSNEGYYCGTIEGTLPGFAADTGSWDVGTYNWTHDTTGGEEACAEAIAYFTKFFAYSNRGNILSTGWGDRRSFEGLFCFWSRGDIQSDMVDCSEEHRATGHGFAGNYMALPHSDQWIRS